MALTVAMALTPVTNGDNGRVEAIPSSPVDSVAWQRDGEALPWTSLVLTDVAAGVYTVTVILGASTATATASLGYAPVRPLSVVAVTRDASGFEVRDGSIRLYIADGVPPYTVQWDHGPTTSSVLVRAGDYAATVTDHSGAQMSSQYHILQPSSFDIDDTVLEVNLLGDAICKDLYSRRLRCGGATAADEGFGALRGLRGHGGGVEQLADATATPDDEAIGNGPGKMVVTVYAANQTPVPVLRLDSSRDVKIAGSLTVLGERSEVTVPSLHLNEHTLSLSDRPGLEDADGVGVLWGAQQRHGITWGADCGGWEVRGDMTADRLLLGDDSVDLAWMDAGNLHVRRYGAAVTLGDAGLVLEGATVINEIPTTSHYLSARGAEHVASGSRLAGDAGRGGWRVTGGKGFAADSFVVQSNRLGPDTLSVGENTLSSDGLELGGAVKATSAGIDIGVEGVARIGAWRLRRDPVAGSLNIEKLGDDGEYGVKLEIG